MTREEVKKDTIKIREDTYKITVLPYRDRDNKKEIIVWGKGEKGSGFNIHVGLE